MTPARERAVRGAIGRGERVAARAVWRMLRGELGTIGATAVLAAVAGDKLRGRPFASLGPARDRRDALSRRQCGDLVLLDRALRRRGHEALAMRVCRAAVVEGAIPFLDAMLPPLDPRALRDAAPGLAESFFNAEGTARVVGHDRLHFDVHRCRFVELLQAVDAAHLMPLFCEADDAFFDGTRRPIVLRRTRTLAAGGASCDFAFQLVGAAAEEGSDPEPDE